MRTIGVVTVGRSDYGIYRPVLRALAADPRIDLEIYVSGMHLSEAHGSTVSMVEADGHRIVARIDMLTGSDSPDGIAQSIGWGVEGFSQAFKLHVPDILVVLGDRFEMFAPVVAALPFKLPVAHIHGGEVTEGAMDDSLRHSMTKMSHLHFVSTEEHGRRVRQLGEEPWRVIVSGAPSLDNLHLVELAEREDLERRHGIDLSTPPLLATFHPATLEYEQAEEQTVELLAALDQAGLPTVFTTPNADTSGSKILALIQRYVDSHPNAWLVDNFGSEDYYSAMFYSAAMVGNSSSGLIEAPSMGLPVVNVGNRQAGRLRGPNVIDVGNGRDEILEGIRRATDPGFRDRIRGLPNPYGDGSAANRIVQTLRSVELGQPLLVKRFCDWPSPI